MWRMGRDRGPALNNIHRTKGKRYNTHSQGHDQKDACYLIDHSSLNLNLGAWTSSVLMPSKVKGLGLDSILRATQPLLVV